MTLHDNFIIAIERCETSKQVYDLLDANLIRVVRNDSDDVGCFSIWLDDSTRIYKPYKSKTMKVQNWTKVDMEYSGTPVFF